MKKFVDDLAIAHSGSAASGRVTLSIGGVTALAADLPPPQLVASADAALYRAKREGRNRASVCLLNGV
jgi:two-component system, chemotaxis family, response regulator WspR